MSKAESIKAAIAANVADMVETNRSLNGRPEFAVMVEASRCSFRCEMRLRRAVGYR